MLWYQLMQSEHFHVYLNHSEANVTQRSRRYFHWTATGRSAPEDVFIGLQRGAASYLFEIAHTICLIVCLAFCSSPPLVREKYPA
jgi:hypothetical protein